jgi:hypothetical protein
MPKLPLMLAGILAFAASGCAAPSAINETGSLPPGLAVRPFEEGQFKISVGGMASQQEVQAHVWAAATQHCQRTKTRPKEIAMTYNVEASLTAAHTLPVVNLFAGSPVRTAGELTFKCTPA